jgi:hypothetical protein
MTSLHLINRVQVKLFVLMKSRFLDNLSYREEPARVNSQAGSSLCQLESVHG